MGVDVSMTRDRVRPSNARVLAAACLGNLLEWYDFIVYTTFAIPISRAFFPGRSTFTSLMETFITFGVGSLARPIGAALFGSYGDRVGRRAVLTLTILLMALGSVMIAGCPTATTIGLAAPTVLVSARLIQGLSAGGEIGGVLSLVVEYAPVSRRAFYASFLQMAQGGAIVLSGLVATIITSSFSERQVDQWAWRLPFMLGIGIAPVGFYIRRQVAETELFVMSKRKLAQRMPLKSIFTEHWRALLIGIGVVVVGTVGTYVTLYIPTYAQSILKTPRSNGYIGLIIVGLVMMACPAAGILADRLSRKSVMLFAAACLVVCAYPAFLYLADHPTGGTLNAIQIGLAILMAVYTGPASALLSELYPTPVRSTGIALAYSLAVATFGSFTPAIVTALIHYTGTNLAVAFWLMISAAASSIALFATRDRSRQELA
jgi:MFS transporter, MHS family, proline/betaine transporter